MSDCPETNALLKTMFNKQTETQLSRIVDWTRTLERQRNALQAKSDAQLRELTAISDALGTNDGHSSVDHILALRAKLAQAEQDGIAYKDGFCVLLALALRFDFFAQDDPIFNRVVELLKKYPMREGVTVESAIDAAIDAGREGR